MGVETQGDLMITSGVDTSGIASGLAEAKAIIQKETGAIASSFSGAQESVSAFGAAVGGSAAKFSSAAQAIIDRQGALETKAQTLRSAVAELQAGYDEGSVSAGALERAQSQLNAVMDKAYPPMKETASAIHETGDAAHEASERVASLAEGLVAFGEALAITEALKEFVTESLSAVDSMQRASNSLTALTGSAEHAEEVIKAIEEIAKTQPFSFPELAQSAQKMAAFGIETEKIPTLLQDAANASRATGNSFDAIVAALGRVELAGQVSGKQLVQLGVSFDDLAKTAGTSVEEVQALLKKGGQSAAEDLELLLKTVEAKFGNFAQVPLTIGEQWKVLQNQMHTVFADIGAAILPIIEQVVELLKNDLIPAVKSGVEFFSSLPTPIRDGAVAFGLLATAAAPVALAIGAVVLGLNAISGAVATAASALGALGISAGVAATAETALAASEEADAVAAGHAAVAHQGLALAQGGVGAAANEASLAARLFGGALGTVGLAVATFGGAIAVTAANVNQLRQKWADTVDEVKSKQIVDALNSGVTVETLKKIGVSVDAVKVAVEGHNRAIDYAKISQHEFVAGMPEATEKLGGIAKAAKEAAEGYDNFGIKVKLITHDSQGFSQATKDVIEKHGELSDKLRDTQTAVSELTKAQDGSKEKAEQLALAQRNLQSAVDALNPAYRTLVKSVGDLMDASVKANATGIAAQGVYDALKLKYDAGTASAQALRAAHEQLQKAMKDAAGGVETYLTVEQELIDKQDKAEQEARLAIAAYRDLLSKYEEGDPVVSKALDNMNSKLEAAGLELKDLVTDVDEAQVVMVRGAKVTEQAFGNTAQTIHTVRREFEDGAVTVDVLTGSVRKLSDGLKTGTSAYGDLGSSGTTALEALRNSTQNTVQIATDFNQVVSGTGEVIGTAVDEGIAALGKLSTQIEKIEKQWKEFADGVGSFSSNLGLDKLSGKGMSISNPYVGLSSPDEIAKQFQDLMDMFAGSSPFSPGFRAFYTAQQQLEQFAIQDWYKKHPFFDAAGNPPASKSAGSVPAGAPPASSPGPPANSGSGGDIVTTYLAGNTLAGLKAGIEQAIATGWSTIGSPFQQDGAWVQQIQAFKASIKDTSHLFSNAGDAVADLEQTMRQMFGAGSPLTSAVTQQTEQLNSFTSGSAALNKSFADISRALEDSLPTVTESVSAVAASFSSGSAALNKSFADIARALKDEAPAASLNLADLSKPGFMNLSPNVPQAFIASGLVSGKTLYTVNNFTITDQNVQKQAQAFVDVLARGSYR